MRRDVDATRKLVGQLRAGRAGKAEQSAAADFVESWLVRWEREALERQGQTSFLSGGAIAAPSVAREAIDSAPGCAYSQG